MPELCWAGKYDAQGRRTKPLRVALPFQTVETVNESAELRQRALDLFAAGHDPEWRNRLIWGDTRYVLPALLPELAGRVNLVYIDPPFDTGADFSFHVTLPDGEGDWDKQPSIIEQKAYRDIWKDGVDSYLKWFYDTVVLLRELLAEDGSIYVHIGSNLSHYVKIVMDEVFGADRYVNEIVWKRQAAHSDTAQGSRHFGRIHDTILFYALSENRTWNPQYEPYDEEYINAFYRHVEPETGRRYRLGDLTAAKRGGGYLV